MKIAIVTQDIFSGGGVPSVVRFLYDALSPQHDCHLISVSTSSRDPYSVRLLSPSTWLKGIQFHKSAWEGKPITQVGAFLTEFEFQRYQPRSQLTAYLNQFDAVIIVAGGPAWAYLAKHVSKPVLLQFATLVREERKQLILSSSTFKKLYIRLSTAITGYIETKALRVIDIAFIENFWLEQYLTTTIGRSKVILAPPGIDTTKFIPCHYHDKHDEHGNKYLVSVGRFNDRRKNVALLFKAYAHLRSINTSAPRLILAGLRGPLAEDWALAETLGIRQHIEFKENISATELIALLAQAAIFVCSSEEEGLGIAMMEALSCGTPVVTTRCGGPETFMIEGKNGFSVGKYSVEEMAIKINELLTNDGLLQRMSQFSREDIVTRFSKEITGLKFLDAIKSLPSTTP